MEHIQTSTEWYRTLVGDHSAHNNIYITHSHKLKRKRIQFPGHFHRPEKWVISFLLLWHPSEVAFSRNLAFPDTVSRDSVLDIRDLNRSMQNHVVYKKIVNEVLTNHRLVEGWWWSLKTCNTNDQLFLSAADGEVTWERLGCWLMTLKLTCSRPIHDKHGAPDWLAVARTKPVFQN